MANKQGDVTLEYSKPRTFRDRKKDHSNYRNPESMHPVHRPYEREQINWTKEYCDEDSDEATG